MTNPNPVKLFIAQVSGKYNIKGPKFLPGIGIRIYKPGYLASAVTISAI